MDSNVNYTIVGGFIIILLTAIGLGVMWLSSGFALEHYTMYKTYIQESVSGVNIDSVVEYNGVNVGNVTKIDLNPLDPHRVQLLLKIKSETPITQGTIASVNSRGLTGVGYISLRDEGNNLKPLAMEPGEKYLVIQSGPSLFLRWDTALTKLDANLSKATKAFQDFFNEENRRAVGETLANLRTITNNLAAQSDRIDTILANTATASKNFGPMIEAGRGSFQILNSQTLPAANKMVNNLNAASRNLLDVSMQLKENPSVIIRGRSPRPLGPGER